MRSSLAFCVLFFCGQFICLVGALYCTVVGFINRPPETKCPSSEDIMHISNNLWECVIYECNGRDNHRVVGRWFRFDSVDSPFWLHCRRLQQQKQQKKKKNRIHEKFIFYAYRCDFCWAKTNDRNIYDFFPRSWRLTKYCIPLRIVCIRFRNKMNGFEQVSIVRCNKFIKSNGSIEKRAQHTYNTHIRTHYFHLIFDWSSIISCRFYSFFASKKS